MTSPGEPKWTPGALARMLGISPNTLRTWDRRYGLGPTVRKDGHHRRYSDHDLHRLRRMVTLTGNGMSTAAAAEAAKSGNAEPAPAITLPADTASHSTQASIRGLANAAARLDAPLMRELSRDLIDQHGVTMAWEEVFAPLLIELGGRSDVEIEHMASASLQHALRQVPLAEERGRLPVLLACAPDEQHTLAMDALAAALSERGCAYRSLGARVPAAALLNTVRRLRPAATVIWAHTAELARDVPVTDLRETGQTTLVVAGPGWMPGVVLDDVRRVTSLQQAVDTVLEICG
ncbi:MerR family transcriptional regulator [Pseudonocardiaceae bacterium YIM PH 21723]|nr:MerR family transcriptional regulator [Pseudonocardiaceae bacterium YIM PH 21723]